MARLSDRFGYIFMCGFVGFFFAPVAIVLTLAIWAPESIDYGNSGLVLLLSVLAGGVFGALLGALAYRSPTPADFNDDMIWMDDLWDKDMDA